MQVFLSFALGKINERKPQILLLLTYEHETLILCIGLIGAHMINSTSYRYEVSEDGRCYTIIILVAMVDHQWGEPLRTPH